MNDETAQQRHDKLARRLARLDLELGEVELLIPVSLHGSSPSACSHVIPGEPAALGREAPGNWRVFGVSLPTKANQLDFEFLHGLARDCVDDPAAKTGGGCRGRRCGRRCSGRRRFTRSSWLGSIEVWP